MDTKCEKEDKRKPSIGQSSSVKPQRVFGKKTLNTLVGASLDSTTTNNNNNTKHTIKYMATENNIKLSGKNFKTDVNITLLNAIAHTIVNHETACLENMVRLSKGHIWLTIFNFFKRDKNGSPTIDEYENTHSTSFNTTQEQRENFGDIIIKDKHGTTMCNNKGEPWTIATVFCGNTQELGFIKTSEEDVPDSDDLINKLEAIAKAKEELAVNA